MLHMVRFYQVCIECCNMEKLGAVTFLVGKHIFFPPFHLTVFYHTVHGMGCIAYVSQIMLYEFNYTQNITQNHISLFCAVLLLRVYRICVTFSKISYVALVLCENVHTSVGGMRQTNLKEGACRSAIIDRPQIVQRKKPLQRLQKAWNTSWAAEQARHHVYLEQARSPDATFRDLRLELPRRMTQREQRLFRRVARLFACTASRLDAAAGAISCSGAQKVAASKRTKQGTTLKRCHAKETILLATSAAAFTTEAK
nr:PREDICTED: uncharacterized protein LOC102357013 [Latimeria chalumnae]|eukprot:XP_006001583.1 PREDICTED: uncharacterized protein LOC102357013 [Latimeria chalumnae]